MDLLSKPLVFWIIVIIVGLLFAAAMYFFLANAFQISSSNKSKNLKKLITNSKGNDGSISDFIDNLSKKIAVLKFWDKLISEQKQEKLTNEFDILGIKKTPKEHLVYSIVSGLLFFIVGLFVSLICFVFGLSTVGLIVLISFLLLGTLTGLLEYNSVDSKIEKRKTAIEKELPRFISVVENTIKNDRDVIKLISDYTAEGDSALIKELKVLLIDLKTGDYEFAFGRFTSRTNSTYITEISRGLVSTMRGDDTSTYFKMISTRLWEEEKARLKKEQLKKPKKVKYLQFMMYACMMLLYIVVLGTVMIFGIGQVFSS